MSLSSLGCCENRDEDEKRLRTEDAMKRLTDAERSKLGEARINEILADLGDYMTTAAPMYSFEDELPWEIHDTLFALCAALMDDNYASARPAIHHGMMFILDTIPSRQEYEARLAAQKKMAAITKDLRAGLSAEEIKLKYDGHDWTKD